MVGGWDGDDNGDSEEMLGDVKMEWGWDGDGMGTVRGLGKRGDVER